MARIYIVGGPGCGKTTLAKRVSHRLAISDYEMDRIGWEGGFGAERPLDVRLQDVHAIATQSGWVVEGWFSPWTNELFEQADVIVWLDLHWRVALWRIFMRHIRASLAGTNKHRGLLNLYRFMGYSKIFYTSTDADANVHTLLGLSKELQHYTQKVRHCQHPGEVEDCFSHLITASEV